MKKLLFLASAIAAGFNYIHAAGQQQMQTSGGPAQGEMKREEERRALPAVPEAESNQLRTTHKFFENEAAYEQSTADWQKRPMEGQPPSSPTALEESEENLFDYYFRNFLVRAAAEKYDLKRTAAAYDEAEEQFGKFKTVDSKAVKYRLEVMKRLMDFVKLCDEFLEAAAQCDLYEMDEIYDEAEQASTERFPAGKYFERGELFMHETGGPFRERVNTLYEKRLEQMKTIIKDDLNRREQKKPCGQ